jgi:F-type H+-transporting ATPase subunit delta
VNVDPVTTRYGIALYDLAKRTGALAEVTRDIERIGREVAAPATRAVVLNPRSDARQKRAALAGVLGSAHTLTQNFVNLLIDKHREEVLRSIADAFRKRILDERGAVEGVVESARPLSEREVESIAATFGPLLSRELVLSNKIVPELVGGARVFAANRMIDYSVQGRLEALRRKMLDARMPSATGR